MPSDLPLGKPTDYPQQYSPQILYPIARKNSRDALGIDSDKLPFNGVDIWNAYELSWLNSKGKPMVGCAEFTIPCKSPAIVESKSFKLYLNSLNQARFNSAEQLRDTLADDISRCAGAAVEVAIFPATGNQVDERGLLTGTCLDSLDVSIDDYSLNPDLIVQAGDKTREQVYSHLLRSLCPVTGQPDWGTIIVEYEGSKINHEGLLKYIIGYRQHQEYHEQCVERIFTDIRSRCKLDDLSVYARFIRRGGLDINPYRCVGTVKVKNLRLNRQ